MPKYCKYSDCGKALTQRDNELTNAFNKRETCNKRCATLHSNEKRKKNPRVQQTPVQSHKVSSKRNDVCK